MDIGSNLREEIHVTKPGAQQSWAGAEMVGGVAGNHITHIVNQGVTAQTVAPFYFRATVCATTPSLIFLI